MKKTLTILGLFLLIAAQAQKVGINTDDPKATLDIKSEGNNNHTKALKITNSDNAEMVTVIDNGNVGIGTTSPATKLDVSGQLRIGTLNNAAETDTKVLVTGAGGVVKTKSMSSITGGQSGMRLGHTTYVCNAARAGQSIHVQYGRLTCASETTHLGTVYYWQGDMVRTLNIVGNYTTKGAPHSERILMGRRARLYYSADPGIFGEFILYIIDDSQYTP